MAFVKLLNGVVVQKQLNAQTGFIEAPDSVVCGMVQQPDGTFVTQVRSIEEWRAIKISETDTEVRRRILALIPDATNLNFVVKELNLLLRGVRLLKKKEAGTITLSEQSELDALDSKGAQIEATKAAGDNIKMDIVAATDPANFNVAASTRWPA